MVDFSDGLKTISIIVSLIISVTVFIGFVWRSRDRKRETQKLKKENDDKLKAEGAEAARRLQFEEDMKSMKKEFDGLRSDVNTALTGFKEELESDFSALKKDVHGRVDEVRREQVCLEKDISGKLGVMMNHLSFISGKMGMKEPGIQGG